MGDVGVGGVFFAFLFGMIVKDGLMGAYGNPQCTSSIPLRFISLDGCRRMPKKT